MDDSTVCRISTADFDSMSEVSGGNAPVVSSNAVKVRFGNFPGQELTRLPKALRRTGHRACKGASAMQKHWLFRHLHPPSGQLVCKRRRGGVEEGRRLRVPQRM